MRIDTAWKERIVASHARDAVKVSHADRVLPPYNVAQVGRPFSPRALRTPLTDRLESDPASVDPAATGADIVAALRAGGGHEHLPFTGQSVELVHDVVPAADLVARLVSECRQALAGAAAAAGVATPARPGA
jgi:nitronate monooxygenase/enoyl-[acyl-carrier protein] reductase II